MSVRLRRAVGVQTLARVGSAFLLAALLGCGAVHAGQHAGAQGAPCAELIPDIYDRVSPAVVSITARSINPYQAMERISRVAGSGIIFDASGLVLTNSHVVFGRQSVTVTLDDGTSLPAELVGTDVLFDLAVLRIPSARTGVLPVAPLGDSERLRVGEEVLAIGNPFGLDQTLTRGVISAINRILPNTPLSLREPLIQTDTPINPGNSGGPLVNRCGEVIGITTAIMPDAQSIGFAIPISLVKAALPSLLTYGRIIRPWLGVQGHLVGRPLRELLRIPLTDGLLIEIVEPGSPAEAAELRGGQLDLTIDGQAVLIGGDIITAVNGKPVDTPEKLADAMKDLAVGATIRLTVFRGGQTREVDCVLPERPILPGDIPGQHSTLVPQGSRVRADAARVRL
jgi:S1-C subfamily serine protease